MRYVLPRSGNTTLCEHLHSMFPMRHIAVYSPHYDMNERWKTYSNDKRIERELYGTLRHSFSFGGHERRSRTTCALRFLHCAQWTTAILISATVWLWYSMARNPRRCHRRLRTHFHFAERADCYVGVAN